jgi:hypothetical protein
VAVRELHVEKRHQGLQGKKRFTMLLEKYIGQKGIRNDMAPWRQSINNFQSSCKKFWN